VDDPALRLILAQCFGFASQSTSTLAQPGSSHSFGSMGDIASGSSSVASCDYKVSHSHHDLEKTSQLTSLSPEQLPIPYLKSLDNLPLTKLPSFPFSAPLSTPSLRWAKQERSSASRLATLNQGLPTHSQVGLITCNNSTRSNGGSVTCHMG